MFNLFMSHWNQSYIKYIFYCFDRKILAWDTEAKQQLSHSILKQIKTEKLEKANNRDLTRDWLIINEISKSRDKRSLKEKWF